MSEIMQVFSFLCLASAGREVGEREGVGPKVQS